MPTLPFRPTPRSPLAQALLPVIGGILLLVLIFGATWGIAAWISRGNAESTSRLTPTELELGHVERVTETIDDSGPVLMPGLNTTSGERTLVLDHTGDDPTRGWRVYGAYPADAGPSCAIEQVPGTARFLDCDGRELGVADLAPAESVCPVVEDREQLSIDLRCTAAATSG